ncbi:MurR/RpiR family transcriptional regulator [Allosediminivita pacifica]|uniref:RpiR family transcriptional regulator n=1 Tax=Allosediminivita pacifica TaxID=1267769 RepID=A0A2T6AG19_9RHOB|nr:MurR/RpiR family transcriptional regulator [Allosediminivita pacifica]PTX42751.1 RpiR family transcriptional regulator [Allosediminivita pacifica]GGB06663.1 RpiR family transcriptional regulator [Allosediminivita pacifica]
MQIRQKLEEMSDQFTPAERQLTSVLLADYPFAGLETIQELSKRAHISAPSISRFVAKLGCAGFQEFQQRLVQELKEGQHSPIDLRNDLQIDSTTLPAAYFRRIDALNKEVAERVTESQFDRLCDLMTDPKRRIFMIGGRMSDTIADFFVRHLRQIRADVSHVPSDPELWPEYLLRMRSRDILLIIDFRRYQANLARFAAQARGRKAQTVVITDKWISPAAKGATELVSVPINSGTVWDSYVPAFVLIEAMLVAMAERDWDATKQRISDWDKLRDEPAAGME